MKAVVWETHVSVPAQEVVLLTAASAASEQVLKEAAAVWASEPKKPAYWSTSRVQEQTYG